MRFTVFVTSLEKVSGGIKVSASNGGLNGPPSVVYVVNQADSDDLRIGKQISFEVRPF